MSCISSDILPSLNARKEIWINTHYFNLMRLSVSNMRYNVIWTSPKIRPKYVDITFEFQFVRISNLEFRFTSIKYPDNPQTTPGDYTLQFHCSINYFEEDPRIFEMKPDDFILYQTFLLDASLQLTSNLRKEFEIKVLVRMIEYDSANNEVFSRQESKFSKMKDEYFNHEPVLKDLCYILDIQRDGNIFSGRQTDEFANLKTTYITRAAKFSSEIAEYKKAKEARDHLPSTDFGPILNYILKGEQKPIDDQDVFEIYFEAHRMGLSFLVLLSRHAIRERIGNQSFLIEALGAADRVGDQYLLMKLAKKYHTIETEQLNPEDAGKLTGSTIEWKFMLQSLNRQLKKKQLKKQVEIGESSKSFTAISPSK